MNCYKCGAENDQGDKFCSGCGQVLDYHDIEVDKINIHGMTLSAASSEELTKLDVKPVEKKASGNFLRTLVILIVVVSAITGVVVGIAIPQYNKYVKAERIITVTTLVRTKIAKYALKYKRWPASASEINFTLPDNSTGLFEIKVKNGVILLTIPEEPGKVAKIVPSANKNSRIVWDCFNGGIGTEFLPSGCFK